MRKIKYKDLNEIQKELLLNAEKVMETAYNPYSNFYVGAALLSSNNKIITASNVENSAYGSTICAERSAILKANSMGIRCFDKLAIITKGENYDTSEPSASCGSCRQVLFEFSQIYGKDLEIIMSNTKKDKIIFIYNK
jgi:cytidine deaminase